MRVDPLRAGCIAALLLVAPACVTTNPRTAPIRNEDLVRRFVLDGVHVPRAPDDLAPDVIPVWEALRAGDVLGARQALDLASPQSRATPGGAAAQGFWMLSQDDVAGADAGFRSALAVDPAYAAALYGLGFLAEAQGGREAAADWYGEAIASDPTYSVAAVRLQMLELERAQGLIVQAERAEASGDDEAALAAYDAARLLGPGLLEPYLRTATIQRRLGRVDEAVNTLQSARDRIGETRLVLEPLGRAMQDNGAYGDAYGVFQALAAIDDEDPEVRALLTSARELYFTRDLPQEYQALEQKTVIDRADLAALIAIRLEDLGARVGEPRSGVIMIDVDGSWAQDYIREVVAWRVMEPFQNHSFGTNLEVSRAMFAEVAYRILLLLGATENAPRVRPTDISDDHFLRDQVFVVAGHGLLPLDRRDRFGLLDPVSGAEAVAAVERLVRLARTPDE